MKTTAHASPLHIQNLAMEPDADGQSVLLEQDMGGHMHRISLHVSQVRALVELMELAEPETDRLKRALLRANELAAKLCHSLGIADGMGHEDLTIEVSLCDRLTDFLGHVCADFAGDFEESPQPALPADTTTPNPPAARAVVGDLFHEGAQS